MTKRIAAAAMLGFLVMAWAAGPALAKDSNVLREAVVSAIGPNGSVVKTNVAQLVHLSSGSGGEIELRVPNVSDLASYRNLSGFRGPSGEGKDLVWRTSKTLDTMAVARFNGKLPVDVHITYLLNGKEVTADELKRQKGNVEIKVDLANVSGSSKNLEYKGVTSPVLTSTVDEYIPMEYVVRVTFPTDRWSNVGGQGANITPDGNNEVASLSGILAPPATSASRTLSFTASTDDALTPHIQIYAVPGLSQDVIDAMQAQFEGLQALYGGTGRIGDNLKAIYEGTTKLLDGAEQIVSGVGENKNGKPVIALDSTGTPTTLLGTLGFMQSALGDQILPAIGTVDKATGKGVIVKDENGNPTTLLGSLQSQGDAYDDKLIPGMQKVIDGIDTMSKALEDGGPQLLDGVKQLRDGLLTLIGHLQTDSSANPGMREGMLSVAGGITQLLGSLQTNNPANPGMREALLAMGSGVSTLIANLQTNNPATPGFREGMLGISQGLTTLLSNLQTNNPGTPGFREGLQGIATAASNAATAFGALDPAAASVFTSIATGVNQLITGLGDSSQPANNVTIIGGIKTMSAGMTQLLASLGDSSQPANQTTIIGTLKTISGGLTQVTAGLGDTAAPPNSTTVIGGLKTMVIGMNSLVAALGDKNAAPNSTTVLGALSLMYNGLKDQAVPGVAQLVDGISGGLDQLRAGMTNPRWDRPQEALDGRTPEEYYTECPACFDPDSPKFDSATADPKFQPSFLEVFHVFSNGVKAALPKLMSFDPKNPGLVDGLKQLSDGLVKLYSALDTGDPDNPGLVDGLEQVHGGLQQVNQGLFAINELGLRTLHGTVGDQGDSIAREQKTLGDAAKTASQTSVLGADAQLVSATYVFDLPAQSTAGNDNMRRGALAGIALAGSVLLARRMKRFEI